MEIIIADIATLRISEITFDFAQCVRILIPPTNTSAADPPAGCSKSPTSHQRALKKRGHVGNFRRRVPHIKSLRRPVTDERAPSPVHFVIHISWHARATRRKGRTTRREKRGGDRGVSRRRAKWGEKERTRPE